MLGVLWFENELLLFSPQRELFEVKAEALPQFCRIHAKSAVEVRSLPIGGAQYYDTDFYPVMELGPYL